ncbi:MAG: hypothetical protein PHV06_09265 [bacterium]|nr:hypothetical protein [bacterium]
MKLPSINIAGIKLGFKTDTDTISALLKAGFPGNSFTKRECNKIISVQSINKNSIHLIKEKINPEARTAYHEESGLEIFYTKGAVSIFLQDSGYSEIKRDAVNIHIDLHSPALKLIPDFLIQVTVLELLRRTRIFYFHAATLQYRNTGVSLTGLTGRGKSTLCYYLLSRGWRFLSDDMTLFNSEGNLLYPFINEMKIPYASLELTGKKKSNQKGKFSYIPENRVKSVKPGFLFILNPRKSIPEIREIETLSVFEYLLGSSIIPSSKMVNRENFNSLFMLMNNFKHCYKLSCSKNLLRTAKLIEGEIEQGL